MMYDAREAKKIRENRKEQDDQAYPSRLALQRPPRMSPTGRWTKATPHPIAGVRHILPQIAPLVGIGA
jgi:hypothetical protein